MAFIILDRDGVINHDSDHYIKSPDEWLALPGSLEAIAKLNQHGYKILVATNQSGISRGFYDVDVLGKIHDKMHLELQKLGGHIEAIFYCPHHPQDGCDCRKPRPGLLYQIRDQYQITLSNTYFIGDSEVDICAALEAGCKPLLVLTGNGKKTLQNNPDYLRYPYFPNLASAVKYVLSHAKNLT